MATLVAGTVPRRAAEPFCRLAGSLWYLASPGARAAVAANLARILGRRPDRRQVVEVFQQGVLNYWDTFALPGLTRNDVLALVRGKGWEHLEAALAAGRGVIIATAHLSSAALVASSVAAAGYPVTSVVEPMRSPRLFAAITAQRARFGMRILPVGTTTTARELLAALRRNEVVGLITDRDVLGTGPAVRFFGAETTFPDGAAALALRTGAPILVAAAHRLPDGTFAGVIEPPLVAERTGIARADAQRLTQALAERLQYHISAHPDQWTVFQRRWPNGMRRALPRPGDGTTRA